MKKKLVKPNKKAEQLKKPFLFGTTRPNDNENCDCCTNLFCGKK